MQGITAGCHVDGPDMCVVTVARVLRNACLGELSRVVTGMKRWLERVVEWEWSALTRAGFL
jgi:hypothetical protein